MIYQNNEVPKVRLKCPQLNLRNSDTHTHTHTQKKTGLSETLKRCAKAVSKLALRFAQLLNQ